MVIVVAVVMRGGDLPGAVALVQAETGMTRQDAERFVTSLG
ncbi:hypothetical protein AB0L00_05785 [Actinoallomurus sp. NPDC052308]